MEYDKLGFADIDSHSIGAKPSGDLFNFIVNKRE
jgi:hypothetical protein